MKENETYLDRAISNYRYALTGLQFFDNATEDARDDAFLSLVAFHLEQAVEFVIRYTLDICNIDYQDVRGIEKLLLPLEEMDFVLPEADYIYNHAEMLSDWEEFQNTPGYFVTRESLQEAIPKIGSFLKITCRELGHGDMNLLSEVSLANAEAKDPEL